MYIVRLELGFEPEPPENTGGEQTKAGSKHKGERSGGIPHTWLETNLDKLTQSKW